MLKILLMNQGSLEKERLLSDIPWSELGFEVEAISIDQQLSMNKALSQGYSVVLFYVETQENLSVISELKKPDNHVHVILSSQDWPFDLIKKAIKMGADYYLTSPVNIDELYEVLQHIYSLCLEEQESAQLQKSILAAGVAQRLDGYNTSVPSQINLEDLISAFFDEDARQHRSYYLALISIGEYRYIIQNQEILSFTVSDVVKNIQQFGTVTRCMLIQLPSQEFIIISPWDIEASLSDWWVRNQETKEFITAIYEKEPTLPQDFKEKIRALRILKNNFVLTNGSGKLYDKQAAQACVGEIPPAKIFNFDLSALITALLNNQETIVQNELARFFQENLCENTHMLTVELVEQIDRELNAQSAPSAFSSKRKSMLIKRLLDVESVQMLYQMMQAYLDDLMTLLASPGNNYHEHVIQETVSYIHQHCHEPFTIEELAESLHYSPNHLRYVFKNSTGHTLSEEIASIRMNQARKLLEETTLRVHEISRRVGYVNPSYFISQFMKKYGATPVQYRQRMNR